MTSEEMVLCEKEAQLQFWTLRFYEFYEVLKHCIKQGTLQKIDILRSFEQNFKFEITDEHEKFVGAFEKKVTPQQQIDSNFYQININKPQYIPARKFFTSLILLGKDFAADKADQIFQLYDSQLVGYLTIPQFKELLDHLYFMNLYALPAMVDKSNDLHYPIQYLKQELIQNAQADKQNLARIFSQVNHKIITKDVFRQIFCQQKTLHNALGLRSRIMPIVGCSTSEIYVKAEMLRRCYAPKQLDHHIRKVRFYLPQTFDDYLHTKTSKSVRSDKKGKKFFSNEGLLINSPVKDYLQTPSYEHTMDEDISNTREDSTQSEDKQKKQKNQLKKTELKIQDLQKQLSNNSSNKTKSSPQKNKKASQKAGMEVTSALFRKRSKTVEYVKRKERIEQFNEYGTKTQIQRQIIEEEIYRVDEQDFKIRISMKNKLHIDTIDEKTFNQNLVVTTITHQE